VRAQKTLTPKTNSILIQTMKTDKFDIYEMVTDRICAQLEQGKIPWRKPWTGSGGENMPRNAVSGKHYNGINLFLLACAPYSSNLWVTFNQARSLGGTVKKREKSWPVVFWKILENDKRADGGKLTKVPLLRYYNVFNVEQCEGLNLSKWEPKEQPSKPEFTPIESAQRIFDGMPQKPNVVHKEQQAYYSRGGDFINMPLPETFTNPEHYYNILFHEATHATGAPHRLNREKGDFFGDEKYAKEELVAEMGACFLSAIAGIDIAPLQENQAAYIANWLGRLRDDKKLVVSAATKAKHAAKYILNETETTEESAEPAQAAA
jgi:antirestriction protein ArdC